MKENVEREQGLVMNVEKLATLKEIALLWCNLVEQDKEPLCLETRVVVGTIHQIGKSPLILALVWVEGVLLQRHLSKVRVLNRIDL